MAMPNGGAVPHFFEDSKVLCVVVDADAMQGLKY